MAVEPPNATRIANNAIARNGSTQVITSIDTDRTPTGIRIRSVFEDMRRMLLARHPWNCAITRATLTEDATGPEFGWQRRYKLPPDCLRWLPGAEGDRGYYAGEVEGGYILTDRAGPIQIRYIRDLDAVPEWSPGLVWAMTHLLAEWLAIPVTQSTGIAAFMDDKADAIVREAKRLDGMETGRNRRSGMVARSSWLGARRMAWTGPYG